MLQLPPLAHPVMSAARSAGATCTQPCVQMNLAMYVPHCAVGSQQLSAAVVGQGRLLRLLLLL